MFLCFDCSFNGYCRKRETKEETTEELRSGGFVRQVRQTALDLNIESANWHEALCDMYRDYPGRIVNASGEEVFLDMEVFETPNIRTWFRDFCCRPCPDSTSPRIRQESQERVRVLATILRASFPVKAATWDMKTANDNRPPKVG